MAIELLYTDANGTDGSDPALMTAVYNLAGRIIRVPANATPAEIKAAVVEQYGITPNEYDTLADIKASFAALDFSTITQLSDTSTNAEIVAAIKTEAQAIRLIVDALKFLVKRSE